MNLRSPFQGTKKVAKVERRFRQENFKNTNFSRPTKPLWDQEKSCWEGPVWSNKFPSRSQKIILSTVLGGQSWRCPPRDVTSVTSPTRTTRNRSRSPRIRRSGADINPARRADQNSSTGGGGGDSGKGGRSQNRLSGWGCPPGTPRKVGLKNVFQ
jgi:hypothetical protein